MRIAVQGSKGGVGTTTITVALATLLNANVSATDPTDLETILTEKPRYEKEKHGNHVRDFGVTTNFQTQISFDKNILVTRNDFLSLNRCHDKIEKFDLVVIQRIEGNSIDPQIFAETCNVKAYLVIDVLPRIARAIDAGVFAIRMPDEIKLPIENYAQSLTKELV